MSKIDKLVCFQKEDIDVMESWFQDAETYQRLGGILPLNDWYKFVKENENYVVWMAKNGNKVVGITMVEVDEDHTGSIAILTNPSLRGRGIGKSLIKSTLLLDEMSHVRKWFAGIEADNKACLKCFQANEFVFENLYPDEDGYYSLVYFVKCNNKS
ncbi:GNAT family N-acetyltransferase [Bacillus sp. S2(2024)]|uniref:GNAT family N-acetyltransferase n=1 Tax=Bacillus sp. S2(2024) TaxID=3162887 RepID=UPI003D22ED48